MLRSLQFIQGSSRSQRRFFARHARQDGGGRPHRCTMVVGIPRLSRFMVNWVIYLVAERRRKAAPRCSFPVWLVPRWYRYTKMTHDLSAKYVTNTVILPPLKFPSFETNLLLLSIMLQLPTHAPKSLARQVLRSALPRSSLHSNSVTRGYATATKGLPVACTWLTKRPADIVSSCRPADAICMLIDLRRLLEMSCRVFLLSRPPCPHPNPFLSSSSPQALLHGSTPAAISSSNG
jgi:hypothetical protein